MLFTSLWVGATLELNVIIQLLSHIKNLWFVFPILAWFNGKLSNAGIGFCYCCGWPVSPPCIQIRFVCALFSIEFSFTKRENVKRMWQCFLPYRDGCTLITSYLSKKLKKKKKKRVRRYGQHIDLPIEQHTINTCLYNIKYTIRTGTYSGLFLFWQPNFARDQLPPEYVCKNKCLSQNIHTVHVRCVKIFIANQTL